MDKATRFSLELDEYRDGARLARLHLIDRRGHLFLKLLPLAGFALLSAYALLRIAGLHLSEHQNLALFAVIAICLQFLLPIWELNADTTDFVRGKWNTPAQVAFDSDAVQFVHASGVRISLPWKYFARFDETETVFVLLAQSGWYVLPKRVFSEAEREQMRRYAATSRGLEHHGLSELPVGV